jgi:hypothetical protein
MTLVEALRLHVRVSRLGWPKDWAIAEWEEHMWLYVHLTRAAPWCPTENDLKADDWVSGDGIL